MVESVKDTPTRSGQLFRTVIGGISSSSGTCGGGGGQLVGEQAYELCHIGCGEQHSDPSKTGMQERNKRCKADHSCGLAPEVRSGRAMNLHRPCGKVFGVVGNAASCLAKLAQQLRKFFGRKRPVDLE